VQNVSLWSAVFVTGGIPQVSWIAVGIFCIVGTFQMGVRLLAYTGVLKIGASRSSSLQSISPLISATIAIAVLKEPASTLIMAGTLLVVCGIVLVSWKAERELPSFRWWHLLLPIGAACLTGMNHPLRRYAFSLSNEPLFFAAFMGLVSLIGFLVYRSVSPQKQRLAWTAGARWPFLWTGIFETLSIVFIMTSLSLGRVVDRRELSGVGVDRREIISARRGEDYGQDGRWYFERSRRHGCDPLRQIIRVCVSTARTERGKAAMKVRNILPPRRKGER
jgi:drug/metabolite transporter (DMT)-like permease